MYLSETQYVKYFDSSHSRTIKYFAMFDFQVRIENGNFMRVYVVRLILTDQCPDSPSPGAPTDHRALISRFHDL